MPSAAETTRYCDTIVSSHSALQHNQLHVSKVALQFCLSCKLSRLKEARATRAIGKSGTFPRHTRCRLSLPSICSQTFGLANKQAFARVGCHATVEPHAAVCQDDR